MASGVLHRNNVQVEGSGRRTLVFGQGFGADQRIWRRLVPRLSRDHRIVLFDYVGVGASDRSAYDPQRYLRLDGYAEDLLEILTALELSDAVFVGHSASAMIGILAAIRAPERFSRLALLAGSARYLDDPPYVGGVDSESLKGIIELMDRNFVGWSRLFAERASQDPDLRREMDETFHETDRSMLRQFVELTLRSDIRGVLGRVSTPSLVLSCTHDEFVPRQAGSYLGEHLPHATLVWLEVTGHCPQFSNPERVEAAIRAYLAGDGGYDCPPPLAA
jgi:sigma-B regulation protein RsbQ